MKLMQATMPATNPSMKLRTPGLMFPSSPAGRPPCPHRSRTPVVPPAACNRTLLDMDMFSVSTRRSLPLVAGVLLLTMAASACTPVVRAPADVLRRVTAVPTLVDDGDRSALASAVGESARYFARLPSDRVVTFGAVA